jgi:hypothetical protein
MRRKTIPSRRAVRFYMSEGTGDEALECLGVWSTAGKERRGRLYSSPGPGLGRDSELRYARSRNGLVSASDTCTGLEKLATIGIGASSDRLSSFVWGIGRTMDGRSHHPCSNLRAQRTWTGRHERSQETHNPMRRDELDTHARMLRTWPRWLRRCPARQKRSAPSNKLCDRSLRRPMRRDATSAAADWGGTRRTIPQLQARTGGTMD